MTRRWRSLAFARLAPHPAAPATPQPHRAQIAPACERARRAAALAQRRQQPTPAAPRAHTRTLSASRMHSVYRYLEHRILNFVSPAFLKMVTCARKKWKRAGAEWPHARGLRTARARRGGGWAPTPTPPLSAARTFFASFRRAVCRKSRSSLISLGISDGERAARAGGEGKGGRERAAPRGTRHEDNARPAVSFPTQKGNRAAAHTHRRRARRHSLPMKCARAQCVGAASFFLNEKRAKMRRRELAAPRGAGGHTRARSPVRMCAEKYIHRHKKSQLPLLWPPLQLLAFVQTY